MAVFALLGTALLTGCSGGGTPSGNFGSGGSTGTGGTGTGTGTTLPGVILTATAHTATETLAWTVPTTTGTTATTYDIYRGAGTGSTLALLTPNYSSTQYTDTAVTVGTTYTYQIVAHADGQTSNSNTDSATVGGPAAVGIGDPPSTATPSSPLFTGANFQYITQSTGSYLTVDLTLSQSADISDLRTVEIGGSVYVPTTGVTASGDHLLIDTRAAGISVPTLQAGQYQSVTVTINNTTSSPVVANAGRLEITGKAPAVGGTETDGPTGYQITLTNTPSAS